MLGAALEEQRKEGEWIEGIAIWVAVAIVIMVGKCACFGSYELLVVCVCVHMPCCSSITTHVAALTQ